MARNQEKAKHDLNRYVAHRQHLETHGGYQLERRPRLATDVSDLKEADKWRRSIQKEIGEKIATIQNGSLPEEEIRAINDDINKLLRTRVHWEIQVKKLGGKDWQAIRNAEGKKLTAKAGHSVKAGEGEELFAHPGYKYFGAAKYLPDVRKLFEAQQEAEKEMAGKSVKKRTRKELFGGLLPDYYGWRDEEDVDLVLAEAEADLEMEREHEEKMPEGMRRVLEEGGMGMSIQSSKFLDGNSALEETWGLRNKNVALVHTPSDAEIDQMLLEKKRKLALEKIGKYLTDEDKGNESREMKALIGKS